MSSHLASSHPSGRLVRLHAVLRQLEKAINDPDRNLPRATRQAELFVDALRAVPAWYEELERRATLVECLCGPGTRYELAKHCAHHLWHRWQDARRFWRPNYRPNVFDQKLVPFWGPLANKGNGEWDGTPQWLSQIEREHDAIDRVFEAYDSSLPLKTRKTLRIWRKACRSTERHANGLNVDGARQLWEAHRAEKANPKKAVAPAMRYLAQHDKTSSSLDSMLAAAQSMVEWIDVQTQPGTTNLQPEQSADPMATRVLALRLVTLRMMAAIVKKSPKTIRRLRDQQVLPPPDVQGGQGRANEWDWLKVKPILEKEFHRQLPHQFPCGDFVRR